MQFIFVFIVCQKLIVVAVHLRFLLSFRPFFLAFKGLIIETVNELIYTPKGERDYGTLACWGTNSIGKQMEPCLFQVVPAGMYKYLSEPFTFSEI